MNDNNFEQIDELAILRDFRSDAAELDPETSERIRARLLETISSESRSSASSLDRLADLGRMVIGLKDKAIEVALVAVEKLHR